MGLNRFDGRKFKTFTTENGLNSNYITYLYARGDVLWCVHLNEEIGGFEDFSLFHAVEERAISFKEYFGSKVPFEKEDIVQLKVSNTLFFELQDGSCYVYSDKKGWLNLNLERGETFLTEVDGDYLVYKARENSGYLRRFNDKGEDVFKTALPSEILVLTQIFCDKHIISNTGDLWLTYSYVHGGGFLIVSTNGSVTAFQGHYPLFKAHFKDFFQKEISAVYLPKRNAFAYADEGVFLLFDIEGKAIYVNDEMNIEAEPILCADIESEIFWISGMNGGFYQLELKENKFNNFTFDNSIGFRGINKINGQLYFNNSKNVIKHDSKKTEYILDLSLASVKDRNDHLWTSAYGKLFEYDPILKTSKQYPLTYKREIWSLYADRNNHIWYSKNGLHRFIPETGESVEVNYGDFEVLRSSMIYHFYEKENEEVLLCTTSGLYEWHPKKGIKARYSEEEQGKFYLPTSDIRHLYFEKKYQSYWLASREDGLIHWQPQTGEHTVYKFHRSSSNTLHAVYSDGSTDEYLWLSTENGIIQFDKSTGDFVVYSVKDGLLLNEMNRISHFQDEDGTIYLGSNLGITAFHPKDLVIDDNNNATIIISELNQYLNATGKIENLTADFYQENQITLRPGDRFFTLTFALSNYSGQEKAVYNYKIKEQDNEWLSENTNTISMSGLPYGRQTLMVQASMANGMHSNVLEIPIVVQRPFYLTWWFALCAILITILSLISFISWRTQRLEEQKKWLTKEVEKRTHTIAAQAEALKELDKAKSKFFSNITHEFRTPLTLILGPVKQLHEAENEPDKQKRLAGIYKNARHLLNLINQLLDLSKLESHQMTINRQYGDLIEYTNSFLNDFRILAQTKEQNLVFITDNANWETYFDKGKWHKIVSNLLSNAIKYTQKNGEINLVIDKRANNGQEQIYLKVEDSGIGITEEELPKIFERFYQINGSTTLLQEGTGIGLALVKELIDLQKGTIRVSSIEGKGTTFEINIPIPNESEEPLQVNHKQPQLQLLEETTIPISPKFQAQLPKPSPTEALQILIIEDNNELRTYLKSCLDASKYIFTEAKDGQEGIEKAIKTIPDLIISDVMMPRKDGFEVVAAIRKHIATSHIPVVLLTAKTALESRLEGLRKGADAYLTKPFSPEELVAQIEQLIKIRQLLQQRYQSNGNNITPALETKIYKQEDKFITELKTYILENISETQLSVTSISEHFLISRTQLYRKVKALTNQNATNFITQIRLEYALELINKNELSVSEIAYRSGFSSPSYFTSVFKRVYGKTPSEM